MTHHLWSHPGKIKIDFLLYDFLGNRLFRLADFTIIDFTCDQLYASSNIRLIKHNGNCFAHFSELPFFIATVFEWLMQLTSFNPLHSEMYTLTTILITERNCTFQSTNSILLKRVFAGWSFFNFKVSLKAVHPELRKLFTLVQTFLDSFFEPTKISGKLLLPVNLSLSSFSAVISDVAEF